MIRPLLRLHHVVVSHRPAEIKGAAQVGLDHLVPLFRLQADEQVVLDDPGIVHQDVHRPQLLADPFDTGVHRGQSRSHRTAKPVPPRPFA